MRHVTIVGGSGFIGASLAKHLRRLGHEVEQLGRGDRLPKRTGDLYFCAGLTSDFRTRPSDTVEAHVTLLNHVLTGVAFGSLTYCSSTRVYHRSEEGTEQSLLRVDPNDPSDLYNLSKLAGEARCLVDPRPDVRVVRLSNVFGRCDKSRNFLTEVVRDARQGRVRFHTNADAAKDYLPIGEAVAAMARVPDKAASRLINIASGQPVSNRRIGNLLAGLLGAQIIHGHQPGLDFPAIENRRMRQELGIDPAPFEESFTSFVQALSDES